MDNFAKGNRRAFMRRGAMGAGAMWMLSLDELAARGAHRGTVDVQGASPYGPISSKKDKTTGLELLKLPDGFKYWSYGWTGDLMSDGVRTPNLHDGMAVVDVWHSGDEPDDVEESFDVTAQSSAGDGFAARGDDDDDFRRRQAGELILVRNHEGGAGNLYVGTKPEITYAPDGFRTGNGGTTNLVFDARKGEWVSSWSSLVGTIRNCAGGVTPWSTWITCEETEEPGHGWNFDVGPEGTDTRPLTDMGRFSHEALMVDPKTGYVYQTKDAGNSGLYKFVPYRRGRLRRGGKLYMLAVRNRPNFDFDAADKIGTRWDVRWVRIDDPTADSQSCFAQGFAKGGARFSRLEGAWWGDRTGYFLSTNGGVVGEGQVFEYDPRDETVTLIYDSPNATDVDSPDNITATPRGGLLLCEDAPGITRLIGLTLHGKTFTYAMNNVVLTSDYNAAVKKGDYRQAEWAGACYSPDGRWLFVNIQTPGITFAITGPWGKGPL